MTSTLNQQVEGSIPSASTTSYFHTNEGYGATGHRERTKTHRVRLAASDAILAFVGAEHLTSVPYRARTVDLHAISVRSL